MTRPLPPGAVVLEDAWRGFPLGGGARTLRDLARRRRTPAPTVQALAGVDLRIEPGETVGIVGRNGAGKTSTLRALAGIVPLDRGRAACGGRVAALIELGAGFGRDFTGRENALLAAALHGLTRREAHARLEAMLAFSGLGDFADAPVRTYSSGMLVRLGFAVAIHVDADVLLVDEVLAVGDEAFQRACLARIAERIAQGTTLVLVSHATTTVERVCDRVVVLDGGRVAFDGPTPEGLLEHRRRLGTEAAPAAAAPARAVFVERVEVRDGDDRPRHAFRPGEELRLVLGLGARAARGPVRVAIEVRRADGLPVHATGHDVDLGGRPGTLTLTVPALPLLGGDYDVVIGVHEPGDPDPGIDRLAAFAVADVPGAHGIVDLGGHWRVEAAAAVPA